VTLDARTVDDAKPAERPYKVFDGGGLFLLVHPKGARYWRLKYRYGGKERLLALGVYPTVSLERAREKRDQARDALAKGLDPGELRRRTRRGQSAAVAVTAPMDATPTIDGGLTLGTPAGVVRLTKPQADALAAFLASVVMENVRADGC
jgi:hypothetical protein